MTEINDGDTVRIAFEGVARKDSLGRVYVNDQGLFTERASSIEILSKRPPQVGDVINSRPELANLPGGSVVVNQKGHALIVRHGRTYAPELYFHGVDSELVSLNPGNPPYRVIYIP